MDVLSAIQGRRSIRHYSTRPVEEEKLNKVLEAARLSPSANNRQNWKFIVIKDIELRTRLAKTTVAYGFIAEAPIIIVACGTEADSIMECGQHRYTIDLSIATSYLILEAHSEGLGTCWIGGFNEKGVKEALGIPDNVRVVAMTPLGYPAEEPGQRPRKKLDEIVCYDGYK